MRERVELFVMAGLLILLLGLNSFLEKRTCSTQGEGEAIHIVLDAGHGGRDPGKVGEQGVLEKDLNLKIAKLLEKELQCCGYRVTMVRRDDETVSRNKGQAAELKKRVGFINSQGAHMAISIHQNSYSHRGARGAQVFYYEGSKAGELMAEEVQSALKDVDESNTRESKSNTSYYLLKKTEIPMIIVECGFLSNPDEAKRLMQEDYQKEIAEAIAMGIENYILKNIGNGNIL